MHGLMQDWQLTLDHIIDHAAERHGRREVVTRTLEGPIRRTTYGEIRRRAKQVSNALLAEGIRLGDRIGSMAFNTARHLELWYGTMGIGAVCHTLNPRLHPDQICWMIRHAEDRILFIDPPFLEMLIERAAELPMLERVVLLGDDPPAPGAAPFPVIGYEAWIAGLSTDCAWGGFPEATAAGLCYTSGTTGHPKGVLYSHRSNMLHTFIAAPPDMLGFAATDVVLPVVPMFHANAWGLPFSAPAVGAKLVMPGARLDGAALFELIETERVTFSAAVPTVWLGLLQHLDRTGERLTSLKRVIVGGSACPEVLVRGFGERHGVEVVSGWGMTETSPLAAVSAPLPGHAEAGFEAAVQVRIKAGRPPLGVELKLVDAAGRRLPENGEAVGHLRIRGPAVARAYFRGAGDMLDEEGFFDTGDIATIDPEGYVRITDRAKDVIKSGGEWISSVAIENIAASHPKAAIAAVIGLPHPKWSERPLLLVQLKPGLDATADEFRTHLEPKIARWWMPDEILFVDAIPLGATGKIDKKRLRQEYAAHVLATARTEQAGA